MASSVKFNEKEVITDIEKKQKELLSGIRSIVVDAALKANARMKVEILYKTGRARRNTNVRFEPSVKELNAAILGTYVNYAIYIERKKPYFEPAINAARKEIDNRIKALGK